MLARHLPRVSFSFLVHPCIPRPSAFHCLCISDALHVYCAQPQGAFTGILRECSMASAENEWRWQPYSMKEVLGMRLSSGFWKRAQDNPQGSQMQDDREHQPTQTLGAMCGSFGRNKATRCRAKHRKASASTPSKKAYPAVELSVSSVGDLEVGGGGGSRERKFPKTVGRFMRYQMR